MHERRTILLSWAGAALMLCAAGATLFAAATNPPAAPPLPQLRSPVQVFRELLVKNPEERAQQIALRPPELQAPLETKINEYLALTPEERELRLQATELRHYLMLLMPLPTTNRAPLLAQITEPMHSAVVSRLETWNLFPPQLREEMLDNEQMIRYFTQTGVASETQRKALLETMPAERRAKLEADIQRWQELPEATRSRIFNQFNQFFSLTTAERDKALSILSEPEREAMEETITAFSELPPQQRATCIRSFEKFSDMGLGERAQFLKKAEAWQRMTPSERQQWRELVARVPELPPLPPGMVPRFAAPTPPLPPIPRTASPPLATNGS